MAALASDWLKHFRHLHWKRWIEYKETWQESRSQCPLPCLCFLGRSLNTDSSPGWSVINVAHWTQVHDMWPLGVFFDLLPDIFSDDFLKQTNKKGLQEACSLLVHLCQRLKCTIVIMRYLLSVRPLSVHRNFSHFRLLWNHWTEFNETWQKARSQRPLPSLCFSGRSEKQNGCPGFWLAETFLCPRHKMARGHLVFALSVIPSFRPSVLPSFRPSVLPSFRHSVIPSHQSLSSQLLLHPCLDLNETWYRCCTTSLKVVGR